MPPKLPASFPIKTTRGMLSMPAVGYGTFNPTLSVSPHLVKPGTTKNLVLAALEMGYRHIDTAWSYGNEPEVGAALKEWGGKREDVWITGKLFNTFHGPGDVLEGWRRSVESLGVDYLDLFLMHCKLLLKILII